MSEAQERQVVIRRRKVEICERCGARNSFRTYNTRPPDGDGTYVAHARCTKCGAPVLVYYQLE